MSKNGKNLAAGSVVFLAVVAVSAVAFWQYQRQQAASSAFMQRFAEKRRELALDRDRLAARFDQRMGGLADLHGRVISRAARAQDEGTPVPARVAPVRSPASAVRPELVAPPQLSADPLDGIPDEAPRPKRRHR